MNERAENRTAVSPAGADANGKAAPPTLSDRVRSLRLPDGPAPEYSVRSWLPWLLCLFLATTTFLFGFRAFTGPAQPADKPAEAAPAAQGGQAVAASGDVTLESKGYIVPTHQIQVSPKVSGMIVKLFVEEGKRVKKDEALAELETTEYEADRDRARAALLEAKQNHLELTQHRDKEIEQAKARWEEAEVQRKQLEVDQKRSERLRTGTALAAREFEQIDSQYLAMARHERSVRLDYELMMKGPRDNKIEAFARKVGQAEAELTKAQWRLDNCTIRAPIAGTILTKFAEEGNIVNQLSMNLKGSLCDMADLSDLEVDLSIQERDIARVHKGQKCKVRSEAYPDRIYEGVVSRLMPIADRAKGAVTVRVQVAVPREQEGVYLKPEMGVVVSFLKEKGN